MKYVVVLADGMADEPIEELGNKTPLEYADTPALDELSCKSEVGMVHTIPEGMAPGSDTANLAVLGYNPKVYYSGRSPLEALSIGVAMKDTDVAIRCNVVTISEDNVPFEKQTIIDHSSSEISTEDAAILIEAVRSELANEEFEYYVGTSYRHCLIWNKGKVVDLVPPHDVLTRQIEEYLPKEEKLLNMMKRSYEILKDHPINIQRKKDGLNPANCCWFWGAGTKPMLSNFEEKTGKKGTMISAVDLLKGIAIGAGMEVADVEGANGGLNTNYAGKMQAAVDALLKNGKDFAYIHVEAPDEMGHQGSYERKVKAIENIDRFIVGPFIKTMYESGEDFRLLCMPDHPTPVRLRTHTSDPVPYLIYDSTKEICGPESYCEKSAKESGIYLEEGYKLIDKLLEI